MENQSTKAQYAHEKALFEWYTPEFVHYEKDKNWFLIAGIVAAFLIFYGIIWGSPFMSIAIMILASVYYLQHNQKPRQIKIIISDLGVKIEDKFYPFGSLKSFWIIYNPPEVTTLHFRTINRVLPELTIQLNETNPSVIRNYLARQLPEEEGKTEGLVNMFIRIFRI